MNIQTTIPISQARAEIFDIAEDVQKPGRVYTFTEKGRPKAVLMSAEEYESLLETMEVLRIFPNLDKDVEQVQKDIKSGAYKKYTTLEELLAKDGFKKTYAAHSKPKAKGRKTPGKNP